MTVKELRERLEQFDDNFIVYVPKTGCSMALVAEAIKVESRNNKVYIED